MRNAEVTVLHYTFWTGKIYLHCWENTLHGRFFFNFQIPMNKKIWILWWCEEGRARAATCMPPMALIRRNSRHSGFSKVRYVRRNRNDRYYYRSVLRFRDVHSGSRIRPFSIRDSGSQIRIFPSWIPDPHQRIKKKTRTQENGFLALENMIWVVHPGSGSWLFILPVSRGQKGIGSWIRIHNTATGKHCFGFIVTFCCL